MIGAAGVDNSHDAHPHALTPEPPGNRRNPPTDFARSAKAVELLTSLGGARKTAFDPRLMAENGRAPARSTVMVPSATTALWARADSVVPVSVAANAQVTPITAKTVARRPEVFNDAALFDMAPTFSWISVASRSSDLNGRQCIPD